MTVQVVYISRIVYEQVWNTGRQVRSVRFSLWFEKRTPSLSLYQDAELARVAMPQLRTDGQRPSLQTPRPCRKFQSPRQNVSRVPFRAVRTCLSHRRCGGAISCDWESVRAHRYSNHASSIRQAVREPPFHREG